MRYQSLERFIVFFLIFCFIAGVITGVSRSQEMFPFSSWFLYAAPPDFVTIYEIMVKEYDGQKVDKRFTELNISEYSSLTANVLTQKMGHAIKNDDSEKLEKYRNMFEHRFLVKPATYEIVKVKYDPLERYHDGKVQSTTIAVLHSK